MKNGKTKLQGILKEDVQKMKKSQFSSIRKIIREAFEQGGGSEWQGVDADLETSLFEYGFVAKQLAERDYDDEWFVMYKIDDDNFDTGHITEQMLNDIVLGNEWADEAETHSFLQTMGSETAQDWVDSNSFITKMSDVLSYWRYANIMGTGSYDSAFPKSQALEELGVEPDEWRED